MRLRTSGVSAVLGTTVALFAAVVLTLPRDSDRGARHNAVRSTRGGVQRLESAEAAAHVVEDPEAVLVFAADGVGDFAVSGPPGTDAQVAAGVSTAVFRLGRCPERTIRLAAPPDLHARSLCSRPVLGRAPPTL